MQQATQLQFTNQLSPNGQRVPAPSPAPSLQREPPKSKESLPPRPTPDPAAPPRRIPRLRAVVESQAFKNILVDEMDMMLSRAATLIQANWRGYRLRQKLISQMTAAKAIQEAWRRFNTKRILRSSKAAVRRVAAEDGDIPYHPPQQVRFQPLDRCPCPRLPVMVSKETQFPSSDSLATCAPHATALRTTPSSLGAPAPRAPGAAGVAFLPHQTVTIRLPCPVSLGPKGQPCLLTETIRSACLIRHIEGDTVKTRHVTARGGKTGAPEPAPGSKCTQAHADTEIFKVPPTTPCPTPTAAKAPARTCGTCAATRAPPKTCPVPTMTVVKSLPHTCPAATLPKAQPQVRPIASLTSASPPARPAGIMAKIPPQVCLLASMLKPPPQARPAAPAAKTPPQPCPVPVVTKTSPHIRLAATRSPLQSCAVAPVPKTPSQTCPVAVVAKPPPQTRLAAMINKTPAQIRSVAAVLKTLCLAPPPAAGNLRAPPPGVAATGLPSTSSHIHLSIPKTKVTVNVKQTAGVVKLSSHSCLADGKARVPRPLALEAAAAKTPAGCLLEAEKGKVCALQRQPAVKAEATSKTNVAVDVARPLSWTKVAESQSKPPAQPHPATEVIKIQSQMYMPVETAEALPQPQLAVPLTKALSQAHLPCRQPKAVSQVHVATSLTQASSQAQLAACLSQVASQTQELSEVLPEAPLAACPATVPPPCTCPSKASAPRTHPLAEQTKALSQGRLPTCLSRPSPPIYAPTKLAKASSQARLATCPPSACPAKVSSQGRVSAEHLQAASQLAACLAKSSTRTHPPPELTVVLPQAHLTSRPPTPVSQELPAACPAKAAPQAPPPAKLAKTPSLAQLISCLSKAQSQAHLPVGLTKTQSQAQLVTEASKCMFVARPPADLSTKTQSQPVLARSKASAQPCHHPSALGALPRARPNDRLTLLQGKAAPEPPGVLVPLLAPAGHTPCNMESWGDSGPARGQPPAPSQDDAAASQIASLCAELAAVLGSQEDLRALLAKALSQGEVRAALSQALSKEVLGATVAKALPQGMLGLALMKALSWGELGIALSRALSRGELRPEHTKAMRGKLAEVLGKTLSDEERAALSQALCQGELGAVLSQALSQAALRTGAIFPKAVPRAAGSGAPAAVEADFRGGPTASWGPTLGLVRPQPSKGPVDAGVAGGQSWNSAIPSVAVRPLDSALAAHASSGTAPVPWDTVGREGAAGPRQSGELMVSVQTVEKIITHAVITIQACARGYLVRRTIRLWHQWATIIQATWRGYCVRRNLARLYRATTVIQAAWRGYCTRRDRAQQVLLPAMWAEMDGRAWSATDQGCFQGAGPRMGSDHRCFQSCQPQVCSFCQSLSAGLGSPPSVVMLVGSSPRTCHMCGHTLPTRVVHGVGRSVSGLGAGPWAYSAPLAPQRARQPCGPNKAAIAIQAAWRGFRIRRQLRQQQMAAKTLQATWRGHYTRSCLTTDALLGSGGPWDRPRATARRGSRNAHWPGV
ncbi:IQ domain-containing protein N [Lepus europaeus]|uniref:IQ domain-containing protein N n=1 Tax=Lepus europaeus TaxID=9983 RepID=UPI002B4602E0|nr:IQ domain-containing protein N [Lepus europaeus]